MGGRLPRERSSFLVSPLLLREFNTAAVLLAVENGVNISSAMTTAVAQCKVIKSGIDAITKENNLQKRDSDFHATTAAAPWD
jgi:hypothetical protein